MTDRTQSSGPVRGNTGFAGLLLAQGLRSLVILVSLLLLIGATIGGYLFGLDIARRPLVAATQLIEQLQPEVQRLKRQALTQNATIAALQAKLSRVQATLDAIRPAKDTYKISPNESMRVADGRLIIGIVGTPSNQSVVVNINGTQHTAVTGDVFKVSPDPAAECQVRVQSFDMFETNINVSCAPAKPQ